MIYIRPS